MNNIKIISKSIIFVFLFYFFSNNILFAENDLDYSVSLAGVYSQINTYSDSNSDSDLFNILGNFDVKYKLNKNFWGSIYFSLPILKENGDESFEKGNLDAFKCGIEYSFFNFKLLTGLNFNDFFQPYLGLSFEESKIERDGNLEIIDNVPRKQIYKGPKVLLGVKGGYDFSDYLWVGYNIHYGFSKWMSFESEIIDSENENADEVDITISLKYWMPNEIIRLGFDLKWQKLVYDETSYNESYIPDTEIESITFYYNFYILL